MRFDANGPNIPDLLLEQRDKGRVVFFCGAGVSLDAGMPTFLDLTKHVIESFDPLDDSDLGIAFNSWRDKGYPGSKTPLDQIFSLLIQEYGRDEVNELVTQRLATNENGESNLEQHRLIARISSDQVGNPQIVTTNFDRLFEKVEENLKLYEPPALPEIGFRVPVTGLTYLHGRLQNPGIKHSAYVLSSADFGRAYLSEAWATRFVQSLLGTYTVVLLGYQAEDPPVRYLLQGLNHDGKSDRSRLYAFDKGNSEEIEAKWRDKGVTAIACKNYEYLWKTMSAWADRADDPRAWCSQVIDMARRGPKNLDAYERGQVAHLVRTTSGAGSFADADPSPTAEWLCVFDAHRRSAGKFESDDGQAETFDPLEVYGLDDDPARPPSGPHSRHPIHDDVLAWRRIDKSPQAFNPMGSRPLLGIQNMPPRFCHLTRWIVKHLEEPVTAWWAIRQLGLHPWLVESLRRAIKLKTDLNHVARNTWNLILEYHSDHRRQLINDGWFELRCSIDQEGWTPSVLRNWAIVTEPQLSVNPPMGISVSKPPFDAWDKIDRREFGEWRIMFPGGYSDNIKIPDNMLSEIYLISEGHLRASALLLKDLAPNHFTAPTCYPDREIYGKRTHHNDEFLRWFLEIFNRMVKRNPAFLQVHVLTWPARKEFYFRKLYLYALNCQQLFTAEEAATALLRLDTEIFWDVEVRRELLFLIADRAQDFSSTARRPIINRLLDGPDRKDHWSEEDYPKEKNLIAARYTRWLTLKGLELDTDQIERLDNIITGIPGWSDGWASSIVIHFGFKMRPARYDITPDELLELSDEEIIEQAKIDRQNGIANPTRNRKFVGLVRGYPEKALSVLTSAARKNSFPIDLWEIMLQNWPWENQLGLKREFLLLVGELPSKEVREMRRAIGSWIRQKFRDAFEFDREIAWRTFDHFLPELLSYDGVETYGGHEKVWMSGRMVERSRRTYEHAIIEPIGKAMDGLLEALNALRLEEGHCIPEEFQTRLNLLLEAPDEGRDQAVSILTHNICWLYSLDSKWVTHRMLPWLKFSHFLAEPAWNGFLSFGKIPSGAIRKLLRRQILDLFPFVNSYMWDHHRLDVAASWVVWMAVFQRSMPDGASFKEARRCLQLMDDRTRSQVIDYLGQIGTENENESGWADLVIPFVTCAWPREQKFRTSKTVRSWVSLLTKTKDEFPMVLTEVKRFLIPIGWEWDSLYRFHSEDYSDGLLTTKYPDDVLELMDTVVSDDPEKAPSELGDILSLIEGVKPDLTKDKRYFRLIDLVESQ